MFATDPKFTGREVKIVQGKKSGEASIEYALDKIGIRNVNEEVLEILKEVKAKGIKKGLL